MCVFVPFFKERYIEKLLFTHVLITDIYIGIISINCMKRFFLNIFETVPKIANKLKSEKLI